MVRCPDLGPQRCFSLNINNHSSSGSGGSVSERVFLRAHVGKGRHLITVCSECAALLSNTIHLEALASCDVVASALAFLDFYSHRTLKDCTF